MALRSTRTCPPVAMISNPHSASILAAGTIASLSPSRTEMKTFPLVGSTRARGDLALGERHAGNSSSMPITSPVDAHLRPEDDVHAGEFAEREDRLPSR